MKRKTLLTLFILSLLSGHLFGQQFFRIKADIKIERQNADSSTEVWIGKSYFDKNIKKLVYQLAFPEKETWLFTDTNVVKVVDGKIKERQTLMNILDITIFNLVLSGNLTNFGMNSPVFILKDVTKEDSLVISTYGINSVKLKDYRILLATKNKKLFGVVYQDKDGNTVSQKLFENYKNFNGLEFPTSVVQIFYIDGKESYEVDTYENILLNSLDENEIYNYTPPAG